MENEIVKTKEQVEIEMLLFDIYANGVNNTDCDLTEFYNKIVKLLNND